MAASQSAAVFRRLGSAPLLLVALAGLALFAKGFFPVKPLLTGIAEPRAYGRDEGAISAPLTRLVFVVVDALRRSVETARLSASCLVLSCLCLFACSDFLLGPDSSMTFSQSFASFLLPFPSFLTPYSLSLTASSRPAKRFPTLPSPKRRP